MALVTGAVCFAGLVVAYLRAMQSVVHAWYEAEYVPERLEGSAPRTSGSARVPSVPWLKTPLERSPALALQMLATAAGKGAELSTIEFAMGTSWGATGVPREFSFLPGVDGDVGFRQAAPLLGLRRRYFVTEDADRYVAELKAQLSQGRPVRVVVDATAWLGHQPQEGAAPRDLVVVGFDGDDFEVYDPVCAPSAPCDDALAGAPGVKASKQKFLEAVDRQALRYKYPWTYSLLVVEAAQASSPLQSALERNARGLIGTKAGSQGPATGSYFIQDLAGIVSKTGREGTSSSLEQACALAAQVRQDDAKALTALFPNQDLAAVTARLEGAAAGYRKARSVVADREGFALTDALLAAAALDQQAGVLLLQTVDAGRP